MEYLFWVALAAMAVCVVYLPYAGIKFYRVTLPANACHEAGHALIAWMLPLTKEISELMIEARVGGGGHCMWRCRLYSVEARDAEFQWTRLVVSLAGEIAVELTGRRTKPRGAVEDWAGIVGCAERLAQAACKTEGRAYPPLDRKFHGLSVSEPGLKAIRSGQEWAERRLRANLPLLERLTEELLQRKRLDQQDLEEILGPLSEGHKLVV